MVPLLSQNARAAAGRTAVLMMLAAVWQSSPPLRGGQALPVPEQPASAASGSAYSGSAVHGSAPDVRQDIRVGVLIPARGDAPAASRNDAHECRRSCSRTGPKPARSRITYQERLMSRGPTGIPRTGCGKTSPDSTHDAPDPAGGTGLEVSLTARPAPSWRARRPVRARAGWFARRAGRGRR